MARAFLYCYYNFHSSVDVLARRYAVFFRGKSGLCDLGSGTSVGFVVNVRQHLLVAKESGRKPRAFRKRGKQKYLCHFQQSCAMSLFPGRKSNQKCPSRAQDSGAYRHTFDTKRSDAGVLEEESPSFQMSNEGEVRRAA